MTVNVATLYVAMSHNSLSSHVRKLTVYKVDPSNFNVSYAIVYRLVITGTTFNAFSSDLNTDWRLLRDLEKETGDAHDDNVDLFHSERAYGDPVRT